MPSSCSTPGLSPCLTLTLSLGEAALWDTRAATLYFVDINGGELHAFDPATGAHRVRVFDEPLACVALTDDGFVGAFRSGLWQLDAHGAKETLLAAGPQAPDISWCNDGRCDAAGRFWIGTKHAGETEARAGLFCFDGGRLTPHLDGITVANGLALSPDGRTLYHTDSPSRRIERFALDPATGQLGPRETFVDLKALGLAGVADGAAVDEAGDYWVALYGGSAIARFSERGVLRETHSLPVPQPTRVAFGGADRKTLFVTSARQGLSEAALAQAPLSGSLFSMRVDTPGLIEHRLTR
ncbi:SMP-30/gluconolactonase/LRE family protein [Larsenimonas suaedae]|uniref:SMP-30/gluconolactonase/LRE family protein n=1 Tax=Larsenimonas suaedae TaxID=1851019 RepID=A0ABU1GS36_9GAMM|nr:SMP-30/gluconolactonase/LRE family protein [Larsenimonas suaedae]MCM2972365.1 SMP-30/gluconolactonase/LRE family protein [Larsenimonas suaedae]MDR5894839.1 SMP-30/gluconolactonase/LRE family protein [Larsenimonas suaedae]